MLSNLGALRFNKLRIAAAVLSWLFPLCGFAGAADSTLISHGPKWVLSLDSRSTIIDKKHFTINGVLTGLRFGERGHKITVGYYWLNYGSKQRLIDLHKKLSETVNLAYYAKTDVRFASLAYWYPLYRNKKWIVYIPAEIGIGQESAWYRQLMGDANLGSKNFFFAPCQLGVYGEFKVTPWVGVGAQVGYRDAIYSGPFRKHFRGPYYSYGLTFYPGEIFSDVKRIGRKRD